MVAAHSPGSEVAGINERRTAVLHRRGMIGSYKFAPSCHCTAGRYHCETSDTLLSTRKTVTETALEQSSFPKLLSSLRWIIVEGICAVPAVNVRVRVR